MEIGLFMLMKSLLNAGKNIGVSLLLMAMIML